MQIFAEHCADCPQCREVMEAFYGELPQPHRLCATGRGILEGKGKGEWFRCDHCGGEFLKGRTDEDSLAECKREFGTDDKSICVPVCDRCFEILMDVRRKEGQTN